VVKQWATHGVQVLGVGSFNYNQITGVNGLTSGAVAETWFFHGTIDAGVPLVHQPQLFDIFDKEKAKLNGKTVLFNGGFLIRYQRTGINNLGLSKNTKLDSYTLDTAAIDKIKEIVKAVPSLKLGFYVQEYDVDSKALALLFGLANDHTDLFRAGFAWGGKPNTWYSAIKPTPTDGTVGTNGQILFAKVNYN